MKRISLLCLACFAWWPCLAPAQNNAAADALARANDEERYNRLKSRLDGIEDTQGVLLTRYNKLERQIESLAREIQELKDKSARSGANYVTREELNRYVKDLQELDKQRQADKELFLKSFKDLAKIPVVPHSPDPKPAGDPSKPAMETGPYTVKTGDGSLGAIVAAFNARYAKEGRGSITVSQVEKANPKLAPNKIFVGQTINIPIPPKK